MSQHQRAQRARTRALTKLAHLYPKVFKRLLNEARANEGLPAVGVVPPGPRPNNKQKGS